jgi:two-component system OmpR family response regulator
MRVLIVEDSVKLASVLRRGLRNEGLAADVALRGEDALWMAAATPYDALILDLMLPGIDGVETCRRLRRQGVWAPVLMLTARDGIGDRVAGLDAGADDYVTKPFSLAEVLARLRALVRRGAPERPTVLEVGPLRLDPAARRAWRGHTELGLSQREFALLELFMRRPGEVLTRLALLESGWDNAYENRSNVIDVYVGRLRSKLDRPFGTKSLETVRGSGYRLRDDGEGAGRTRAAADRAPAGADRARAGADRTGAGADGAGAGADRTPSRGAR